MQENSVEQLLQMYGTILDKLEDMEEQLDELQESMANLNLSGRDYDIDE